MIILAVLVVMIVISAILVVMFVMLVVVSMVMIAMFDARMPLRQSYFSPTSPPLACSRLQHPRAPSFSSP